MSDIRYLADLLWQSMREVGKYRTRPENVEDVLRALEALRGKCDTDSTAASLREFVPASTETMKDGERAAFEAWLSTFDVGANFSRHLDSGYNDWDVERAWAGCQARAASPQSEEPVAWMVLAANTMKPCEVTLHKSETEALRQDCVIPLYTSAAAPQAALSIEQREAIEHCLAWLDPVIEGGSITALRALLNQAPTERMSDAAFADNRIACSSCGLTMGESSFLTARKAEIERGDGQS